MSRIFKHYVTIQNKKYFYTLIKVDEHHTSVECEAANIDQEFPNEDVPQLLIDLPNLIIAEKEYNQQQSEVIRFRVSQEDKKQIEKKALQKGYSTISSFLRELALSQ